MLSHSDKRSEACACNGAHYCPLFAPIVCTLPWAKLAAPVSFSRCGICRKVEGHCTRLIGPNLGANGVALAA